MGKQYISTVTATDAHASDILGVAVTSKYTITVSSDGYANFWSNNQDELEDPNVNAKKYFINKSGIHHIASYENILPNSDLRVVILAFGCFDGSIKFKYYEKEDLETLKDFHDTSFDRQSFWCPGFHKDPESRQDFFIVTLPNGTTQVYRLDISIEESNSHISLERHGEFKGQDSAFPNTLAISQTIDKKVAVGYTNGEVQLFDLASLKPIYTFPSTDLQTNAKSSSSIARAIEFSPGGSILAVARDSQSAGSINLYDVAYGENVGSLTVASHSTKSAIGGFAHDGWIMGLSFNEDGKFLLSGGFDRMVRVWDLESREREATIQISVSDLDNPKTDEVMDNSVVSGAQFIKKNIRGGLGGDKNEGICIISFDRGIRWYREAGGI